MGIGFGALKQMNDTIQQNRAMLGKKLTFRERYKQEIKNTPIRYENTSVEFISAGLAEKYRRNKRYVTIARIGAVVGSLIFLSLFMWLMYSIDFFWMERKEPIPKSSLFTSRYLEESDGYQLKMDYFREGTLAAETLIKDGNKNLESKSYYETGELFRTAIYYYDTLVTDTYFFKSGEAISNFPEFQDDEIHEIELFDEKRSLRIEFDFYDGKIVQETYSETDKK